MALQPLFYPVATTGGYSFNWLWGSNVVTLQVHLQVKCLGYLTIDSMIPIGCGQVN